MEKRHLDGIYLRVLRGGHYEAICLSDMTEEELEASLNPEKGEWLKGAVIYLARRLRELGDLLDIYCGEKNDE